MIKVPIDSSRFIQKQFANRKNIFKLSPDSNFFEQNVRQPVPFFSYLLQLITRLFSLSILKTEKAPRFGICDFEGYLKSHLRLTHVVKKGPGAEKVGGRSPHFAKIRGTKIKLIPLDLIR